MKKIYITGDCHGFYERFSAKAFPEQKQMDRDDFVIVTGDFGFWDNSEEQQYWRKWLTKKPFTLLWADGNHENFDMLNSFPVEKWHGGNVHRISENILHLMRGQVFDIQGKKWFVMGGAPSHDIDDGILDPSAPDFHSQLKKLRKKDARFRILHRSWWPQELPNDKEYETAQKVLAEYENRVDYIVTHEAPRHVAEYIGRGHFADNALSNWLEDYIVKNVEFSAWFFGHYHGEYVFKNIIGLYKEIISLEEVDAYLKNTKDICQYPTFEGGDSYAEAHER